MRRMPLTKRFLEIANRVEETAKVITKQEQRKFLMESQEIIASSKYDDCAKILMLCDQISQLQKTIFGRKIRALDKR